MTSCATAAGSVLWDRRGAACAQGYYRRADANLGLGKVKNALNDFRRAAKVNARDPDLRKKLEQCEREVKRLRFEEALAAPVRKRPANP